MMFPTPIIYTKDTISDNMSILTRLRGSEDSHK